MALERFLLLLCSPDIATLAFIGAHDPSWAVANLDCLLCGASFSLRVELLGVTQTSNLAANVDPELINMGFNQSFCPTPGE